MKELVEEKKKVKTDIPKKTLLKAYELMSQAVSMTELYEENKAINK